MDTARTNLKKTQKTQGNGKKEKRKKDEKNTPETNKRKWKEQRITQFTKTDIKQQSKEKNK